MGKEDPCEQNDDTQSLDQSSSLDTTCSHGQHSSMEPWARLISVEGIVYPNINIWEDEVTFGRKDAMGDKRISKAHCKIQRDAFTGNVTVTNLSGNGTLVKGHFLAKKDLTTLQSGDEIVLGPHILGYPMYIFQMSDRNQPCQNKRHHQALDMDVNANKNPDKVSSAGAPIEKKLKVSQDMENIICGICLNAWHDVVSIMPCLHNYCNGCFSSWYKTCKNETCTCPKCRKTVISVGRNHTLNNLVEEIIKDNPSLMRTAEDIAELDKKAIVKLDYMKLADDDGYDYSSNYSDDENEHIEQEQCRQCPRQGFLEGGLVAGVFQCGPETRHLMCSSCCTLMPERPESNVPQKCGGCTRIYCDAYWRSQILSGSNGVVVGCVSPGNLKPLREQRMLEMPRGTFKGNTYEQEVTRRYMSEQRLAIQDVLREWLNKLDAGEVEQPKLPDSHASVTSASYVCDQCADTVIRHLLYKFRLSVPKSELPPEAAGREDCWYGHFCRTQHHKEAHAHKLNHVCEPTRKAREN